MEENNEMNDFINSFTNNEIKARKKPTKPKDTVRKPRNGSTKSANNNQSKRDPLVAWLEDQPEIQEVFTDQNGFIVASTDQEGVTRSALDNSVIDLSNAKPSKSNTSEYIDVEVEEEN